MEACLADAISRKMENWNMGDITNDIKGLLKGWTWNDLQYRSLKMTS